MKYLENREKGRKCVRKSEIFREFIKLFEVYKEKLFVIHIFHFLSRHHIPLSCVLSKFLHMVTETLSKKVKFFVCSRQQIIVALLHLLHFSILRYVHTRDCIEHAHSQRIAKIIQITDYYPYTLVWTESEMTTDTISYIPQHQKAFPMLLTLMIYSNFLLNEFKMS